MKDNCIVDKSAKTPVEATNDSSLVAKPRPATSVDVDGIQPPQAQPAKQPQAPPPTASSNFNTERLTFLKTKFYGRSKELEQLQQAYKKLSVDFDSFGDHVVDVEDASVDGLSETPSPSSPSPSSSQVVLIGGYAGTGKSRLVYRLQSWIETSHSKKKTLCLSGKADEHLNAEPYSSLVDALAGGCVELTNGSMFDADSVELKTLKGKITSLLRNDDRSLTTEGNFLLDMIPGLTNLLVDETTEDGRGTNNTNDGNKDSHLSSLQEQPLKASNLQHQSTTSPVSATSSSVSLTAVNNQLRIAFLKLIEVFTSTRTIVIFLDDLQWCDQATCDLFSLLATQESLKNIMIIGAYRDTELEKNTKLRRLIQNLETEKQEEDYLHLKLESMSKADIAELVSDVLRREVSDVSGLVEVIYNKTQGKFKYPVEQRLKSIV